MSDAGSDGPFFDTVGPWVQQFADAHNLRLKRWFKDIGIWALHFKHPLGGEARIDIRSAPGRRARIGSCWLQQEAAPDAENRRIAWGKELLLRPQQPEFSEGLSQALRVTLGWNASDLNVAGALPEHVQRLIDDSEWLCNREMAGGEAALPEPEL